MTATPTLRIADRFLSQIEGEARAAFPRECCGLIEGSRADDIVSVVALHPTRNLSIADDAFAIDPVEQFKLTRALRGTGRELVGCYHSHPNGRAAPSARDHREAGGDGFVWLIAAATDGHASLVAFVWQEGGFRPMPFAAPR